MVEIKIDGMEVSMSVEEFIQYRDRKEELCQEGLSDEPKKLNIEKSVTIFKDQFKPLENLRKKMIPRQKRKKHANKRWSLTEDRMLIDANNKGMKHVYRLAKFLGRTYSAVSMRRRVLGIEGCYGNILKVPASIKINTQALAKRRKSLGLI